MSVFKATLLAVVGGLIPFVALCVAVIVSRIDDTAKRVYALEAELFSRLNYGYGTRHLVSQGAAKCEDGSENLILTSIRSHVTCPSCLALMSKN
jgi:hypothetical protein